MLFLKKTNRRTLQDYLASTIIINVLKHNELMKINTNTLIVIINHFKLKFVLYNLY